MKVIRTDNIDLVYMDDHNQPVSSSLYLGEDMVLVRALQKITEDEDGYTHIHVGWKPVNFDILNNEDKAKVLDPVWEMLTDIPTDIDNSIMEEYILEDFYIWRAGTLVLDIWAWFKAKHPEGVSKYF